MYADRRIGLVIGLLLACAVLPAQARTALSGVRSFVYASGATAATPGFGALIAASPIDLFIVGYPGDTDDPTLARSHIDPERKKIILGGIDVAEGSQSAQPYLFTQDQPPTWFGGKHPTGAWYSVQYWRPEWKAVVLRQIDHLINQGYDGAFLDVLYGDNEWEPGNIYGNAPYANRKTAMAQLLKDIVAHVRARQLPHFYLLAGNPAGIGDVQPEALQALDGVFFDGMFYVANGAGSTLSSAGLSWYAKYAQIYDSLGLPIFINDYPIASDLDAARQAFEYGSARGWVTTLDPENMPGDRYLRTGPFLFLARNDDDTVTGSVHAVNFLSGGNTLAATLVAGNQGDHMVGGPGRNRLLGGDGDDVIYPHPQSSVSKGLLVFEFWAHNTTPVTPEVQIMINGQVALAPTPITASEGSGTTQIIQVDPTPFGPIENLVISGLRVSYQDADHFSHIRMNRPRFSNQPIGFDLADFAGQSVSMLLGTQAELDTDGSITFKGSAFNVQADYPKDTASMVDGGGGYNTVHYGANYSNYALLRRDDGCWEVQSARTAEGPDTLCRVQNLVFSDMTATLPKMARLAPACIFAYAAALAPELFGGTALYGSLLQYTYAYFPDRALALGVDQLGGLWMIGPATQNRLRFLGLSPSWEAEVQAWVQRTATRCG